MVLFKNHILSTSAWLYLDSCIRTCFLEVDEGLQSLDCCLRAVSATTKKPGGSKYPILEVSGSQNHTLHGIRDQRA